MINFDTEPCSNNNSMAKDQSPKVSNSFRVSTINNISIKSETEDFSALINNPEDRTYLGRILAKEYLGIKEEFYQAYHQFSPPPKHPTLNISGQNNQLSKDSGPRIISGIILHNIVSRNSLVNNGGISTSISYLSAGLMGPSAKLGEEDWAKALELKRIYNFQKTEESNTSLEENKSKNNDHTQENLWDDVLSGTVKGGMTTFRRYWAADVGIRSETRKTGVARRRTKGRPRLAVKEAWQRLRMGGNDQCVPLFVLRTALGRGITPFDAEELFSSSPRTNGLRWSSGIKRKNKTSLIN
ncbi:hypothetical protein PSTG_14190 [Puccinia striiformis f. sp. tritici PST-78]|uniref:Uncharacterized protein n=1 Tax=Puccinia striiformis f. sp. tritici PST-78 TaxID=1165861 RepID=A0A0L0UZE2_9BASI|nr:hypothetical protein PSTG_14190 [Puccinia striiformis f. sp. tritici PST-78]